MEEVDRIIIHSLKDIGCDIDDEVQTLEQFTTDLIVDATVRCLEIIQPSTDIPKTLPQNMASRFHLGSALAHACQDLGYNGDVGYQTFLYSNVVDVRRVFMFLIEKLPREAEKVTFEPDDPISKLRSDIGLEIRKRLNKKKVPIGSSIPFLSVHLETGIIGPGTKVKVNPKDWREYVISDLPFLTEQTTYKKLLPSIINLHSKGLLGNFGIKSRDVTPGCPPPANDFVIQNSSESHHPTTWLNVTETMLFSRELKKPTLGPEEVIEPKLSDNESITSLSNENVSTNSAEDRDEETVEKLRANIEMLQSKIKETHEAIGKIAEDCKRELRIVNKRSKEIHLQEKAFSLLPESQKNLKELEDAVSSYSEKILSLAKQWEAYRKPLLDTFIGARGKMANKESQNEEEHEHKRNLKNKIEVLNKQLVAKRTIIAQLEEEIEKLPKNINRSAYTRRIMEIIGNIAKQKDQIEKILSDTKDLQKEINSLNGRLERLFAVTEETIYRNARKDEFSKRSFKLLATLHSDCATIVSLVLEIGTITREITDLKEQIEVESRKNTTANLERITADLEQMRAESRSLKNQMQKLHVSDVSSHPLS